MAGTDKREAEALERTLKNYRTTNALIRDILNDDSEPADKVKKATKAEAEVALGRIASIVEAKVGADDLDAVNEFLLQVGRNVAEAASENALGLGDKVSKHESVALKELEVLLRATDAQKKARRDNALKEQAQAATTAKQQAEKAEHARQEAEAKAKAEEAKKDAAAKERLEQARAEAEARKKEADQKERLEHAREEAEARQKEAQAKREAEAKAEEERLRVEAEAKAREEAARAEAAKQSRRRAAPFPLSASSSPSSHRLVAGDNPELHLAEVLTARRPKLPQN